MLKRLGHTFAAWLSLASLLVSSVEARCCPPGRDCCESRPARPSGPSAQSCCATDSRDAGEATARSHTGDSSDAPTKVCSCRKESRITKLAAKLVPVLPGNPVLFSPDPSARPACCDDVLVPPGSSCPTPLARAPPHATGLS